MGGDSAEREISLKTGGQIMAALDPARYDAFAVDARGLRRLGEGIGLGAPGCEAEASEIPLTFRERPDVVFIALHGPGGEDGSVQGMLDLLGIPYTGSGVLASSLAMDKAVCKRVLHGAGIATPWSRTVSRAAMRDPDRAREALGGVPLPVVVKPNRQGSSFGMTIVREPALLEAAARLALQYDHECLLEEFLAGTEITVAVLGNERPRALPAIEIVPKGEFYDFASKYEVGGSRHIIPARIGAAALEKAERYALACHEHLGCRGMSRTDMIVRDDEAWVLEVNTIPGMTRTSLLPDAAAAAGIPFSALLDGLIADALDGQCDTRNDTETRCRHEEPAATE